MLFTEQRLEKFLRDNPDHLLTITATTVDGEVQVTATVAGEGDGKVVEVAKIAEAVKLEEVPCKLAEDFRAKLLVASKVEDRSKLPTSQRTAMGTGIPGIAEARIDGNAIREALPKLG